MIELPIHTLPVLTDNYIHIVVANETNTIVVDPAEALPVKKFLSENSLNLSHIFITHHHGDHIGGVKELKTLYPDCKVIGFKDDAHRLPPLTDALSEGSLLKIGSIDFEVWHLPGHTTGHIAYISKSHQFVFSGDVLFGMGCGRVFEGTYQQMFHSLQRLKSLDPRTSIYCTHEYTVNNGRFAVQTIPENRDIKKRLEHCELLRADGQFTVPLVLNEELRTNPFLLAKDVGEFSKYRDARNKF